MYVIFQYEEDSKKTTGLNTECVFSDVFTHIRNSKTVGILPGWPPLGAAALPRKILLKVSQKGLLRTSSQDGGIGKHASPSRITTEKNYN